MTNFFLLLPYLLPVLFAYISFAVYSHYSRKEILIFGALPLFFVSIFRGDVGTDTINYQLMVEEYRYFPNISLIEPGFDVLVLLLSQLSESNEIVIRLISVVFAIIFVMAIIRSKKIFLIYFFLLFIPLMFFNYSMNGLRIGLASLFFIHAVISFENKSSKMAFIFFIAALCFHISILLPIIFFLHAVGFFKSLKQFLAILGIVISLLIVLALENYHIFTRVVHFASFQSPSMFSGLSQVFVIFFIMLAVALSRLSKKYKIYLFFIGILFSLVFFTMARFSYYGLRFLDLLVLSYPFILIILLARFKVQCTFKVNLVLFVAGLIGLAFKLENFIASFGTQDGQWAAWVPYTFLSLP